MCRSSPFDGSQGVQVTDNRRVIPHFWIIEPEVLKNVKMKKRIDCVLANQKSLSGEGDQSQSNRIRMHVDVGDDAVDGELDLVLEHLVNGLTGVDEQHQVQGLDQ